MIAAVWRWLTSLFRRPEPQPEPDPQPEPNPEPNAEAELWSLHNRLRATYGRAPLKLAPELSAAARDHAQWMARTRTLSHTGAAGTDFLDRIERHEPSFRVRTGGENIAAGQSTPYQVVNSWSHSAGHRKNIISPEFEYVGFGMARSASGQMYWCAVFAG